LARLRPLPYREVVRKLNAAGFDEVSRRSSHVKFVKDTPEGVVTAVVPDHRERRKTARETMRILERAASSPKSW